MRSEPLIFPSLPDGILQRIVLDSLEGRNFCQLIDYFRHLINYFRLPGLSDLDIWEGQRRVASRRVAVARRASAAAREAPAAPKPPDDSPRAQTCTFEGPGLQTPPKFNEKTPQEREERMKIVVGPGRAVKGRGRSKGGGWPTWFWPNLAKVGHGQTWYWPHLVWPSLVLAKLGFGQRWFGQTWFWPKLAVADFAR